MSKKPRIRMSEVKPLLSVEKLKTCFELDEGTVKAVDGVSFKLYPSKILGIVGESGCGKSITIKSILRILEKPGRITSGKIMFHSTKSPGKAESELVDLAQLEPHCKQIRSIRGNEIALIPQEPMAAFSPVHTIGNQITEAVLLHSSIGSSEAQRIVIKCLREVGIPNPERCMEMYSWELSGGLRQRALISMALVCEPSLLIADEPTTAIDVTTQAQILNLLRILQKDHNTAIIFITHDLGVISQLADDVVVMYLGRVMEVGPVDDIFHNPQHPYTKALLKSIPTINTVNRSWLPTIEGSIPHAFHRPKGCPFHQRCQDVIPGLCDQKLPALHPVTDHQSVSCFKIHDFVDQP